MFRGSYKRNLGSAGSHLGKERERLDVCGADDGEVPVIESGDALLAVAFGERDEPGVGTAQPQVGVLDHEIVDPLPIGDGERFDV